MRYNIDDVIKVINSKPDYIRTGQAFCNHFGVFDHDLFYETDHAQAIKVINSKYIKKVSRVIGFFKELLSTF